MLVSLLPTRNRNQRFPINHEQEAASCLPTSLEPVGTLYILAHPPPPPVTSSSNHCLPPIPPTPPPGPSSPTPTNRPSSTKYQRQAFKSLPSTCERAFKMVLQLPRSYLTTPLLLFLLLLGANWVLPSAGKSSEVFAITCIFIAKDSVNRFLLHFKTRRFPISVLMGNAERRNYFVFFCMFFLNQFSSSFFCFSFSLSSLVSSQVHNF